MLVVFSFFFSLLTISIVLRSETLSCYKDWAIIHTFHRYILKDPSSVVSDCFVFIIFVYLVFPPFIVLIALLFLSCFFSLLAKMRFSGC